MIEESQKIVWVIETGDYEERRVVGVARSVDAAASLIKRRYLAPYIVEWKEPKQDRNGDWSMMGHFGQVFEHSIKHSVRYDFLAFPLDEI
jgi:hypothetical protein